MLQFERKITLGNVLEIIVMLTLVVIAFTTMQMRMDDLARQVEDLQKTRNEIIELERRLGTQYVRSEVFAEIKVQLTDIKMELKNISQQRNAAR